MPASLLLVEDDSLIRRSLAGRLRKVHHRVREADSVGAAGGWLDQEDFDVVLVDYRLPDGTGFDVMQRMARTHPKTPCLMLTAHASVEHAVEAMRRGAYTYLEKPVDPDELELQVAKALEAHELHRENRRLRRLQEAPAGSDRILGDSRVTEELRTMVRQVAASPARTILLQGESGTGKGLIARALHGESARAGRPFVSITCSAVPDTLLESELFGHEPGAFTDARKRKLGLLEAADGGTLFLDEIGDMPPGLQAKLLGVLEERSFRRIGGVREISVDVRVISATHRDLDDLVRKGRFREDLLYRLRVIPIRIPPLRERPDDIALLARHFTAEIARDCGRPPLVLSDAAASHLASRRWPGNVRELRNAVERAVILAQGQELRPEHFQSGGGDRAAHISIPQEGLRVDDVLDDLVRQALDRAGGNQSAAARLLGLSRDQVRYRMQKMGLLHREGAGSSSGG